MRIVIHSDSLSVPESPSKTKFSKNSNAGIFGC